MASTEFRLPDPPLGAREMMIVRWLRRPKQPVSAGEALLIAVNDRVEVAFPAPAGILEQQLAPEGAQARAGDLIATLATQAAQAPHPSDGKASQRQSKHTFRISPLARRVAADLDVDPTTLSGSGISGRIMKNDILTAHALSAQTTRLTGHNHASKPAPASSPEFSAVTWPPVRLFASLPVEVVEPHTLTAMDVDMSAVGEARARLRTAASRRRFVPDDTTFITLAAVAALAHHPLLNAAWAEDMLITRRRIHLGLIGSNGRLRIIRDAQDLNLHGLALASDRAPAGDVEGAEITFTVDGSGGNLWFITPTIGPGQSAALGLSATRACPVVVQEHGVERVAIRPVALLALTYDARVLGPLQADAFLRDVKARLEGG
jgi:pyruvate dehydrogenase E2 component (dihydrolipoamide acetyltransferase)